MEADEHIGLCGPCKITVDELLCPAALFLGRLEKEHDGSRKLVPDLGKDPRTV